MNQKSKTKKKLLYATLLIIIVISFISIIFIGNKDYLNYGKIKNELLEINNDSLSKYYQLFKVLSKSDDYNKKDFLDFLADKNFKLQGQLAIKEIKLNSKFKSEKENIFEGFYHIGIDGIDNNARWVINSSKEIDSLEGDIIISTKNFYDLKLNNIYTVKNNDLLSISSFYANKVLAKSLNCKSKVKMKLDTIDYFYNSLKFKNGKILDTYKKMDMITLKVILKDSLLNTVINKYDNVFIPFSYKPIEYFYCDDSNEID